MISFFKAILYRPMYNLFIGLIHALPFLDAGIIIIIFTLLVRLVLFPLSKKGVRAQMQMKEIQPELDRIKIAHKDNREEQARLTMALYKEKKINPFSSILVLFIQIPIVLSMYYVFIKSGLPVLNESLLYSFTPHPTMINMNFLGLVSISGKSVILAVLAGLSSFFQLRYSVPPMPARTDGDVSFKNELARNMNTQMRYVFPFIVFLIGYSISGVVALYWTTTNLFTLGQEIVIRRKYKREQS